MVDMNIREAEHFESLLKTRTIDSIGCMNTGRGAIEDVCVYNSKDKYKGNVTISLMKNGERGFFFVECDNLIIRIIDISTIRQVETYFINNDKSGLIITYNKSNTITFSVLKGNSFFRFDYNKDK